MPSNQTRLVSYSELKAALKMEGRLLNELFGEHGKDWQKALPFASKVLNSSEPFLTAIIDGTDTAVNTTDAIRLTSLRQFDFNSQNPYRVEPDLRTPHRYFFSLAKLKRIIAAEHRRRAELLKTRAKVS